MSRLNGDTSAVSQNSAVENGAGHDDAELRAQPPKGDGRRWEVCIPGRSGCIPRR